jgi:hypothetical protein
MLPSADSNGLVTSKSLFDGARTYDSSRPSRYAFSNRCAAE